MSCSLPDSPHCGQTYIGKLVPMLTVSNWELALAIGWSRAFRLGIFRCGCPLFKPCVRISRIRLSIESISLCHDFVLPFSANGNLHISAHAVNGIISVVFTQWPTPFFRFRFPADAVFGRQNDDFEQMFFDFMVTGFADARMRYRLFFGQRPEQCRNRTNAKIKPSAKQHDTATEFPLFLESLT